MSVECSACGATHNGEDDTPGVCCHVDSPRPHAHRCPDCFETKRCLFNCTIDWTTDDTFEGLPIGDAAPCDTCVDGAIAALQAPSADGGSK